MVINLFPSKTVFYSSIDLDENSVIQLHLQLSQMRFMPRQYFLFSVFVFTKIFASPSEFESLTIG